MDPRKIGQFLMGQWETTKQPLKERATVLPLGQYEDGSIGLAWPGLLADPVQRGYQAANTPIPPVNDDKAWADKSAAMFDVTSLAPMGAGLAGGIVDNAVGSAGGRLTQPQGIRAYHGSPHDFDKFDLSKIGTGEGAQAYGHGLYFAGDEAVARSYRDKLENPYYVVDGIKPSSIADSESVWMLANNNGDAARAIKEAQQFYDANDPFRKELEESINKFATKKIEQVGKGKMYEVNIRANPEDFLDWDKPLSQQPATVRQIVDNYNRRAVEEFVPLDVPGWGGVPATIDGNPKGSYVHSILSKDSKSDFAANLHQAGIPGIRYLDGMSRDAGEGSSNYVVFDDQLIDILRKYANAPTGALPGIAAQTQDGEQNPALIEYLKAIGLY